MRRALTCLGLVVALAAPAGAQPSSDFTREFQAGTDAYRLGDYAAARVHLERARALDDRLPGPHRFLAAVGAAEGKWQECVDDARRAIAANPASSEIAATRKLHDDCRGSLGLASYTGDYADGGAIAVTANVSGAAVTIAGLRSGSTPLAPRPIGLGLVEITASKSGWRTATATVTILPGVVTDVALVLAEDTPSAAIEGGPAVPDRGWLIVAAPAGATITVDDARLATDDRGRYGLAPGEHVVRVEQAGSLAVVRTVRVARGQAQRVEIALVSIAGAQRTRMLGKAALGAAAGLGALGVATALLSMRASDQARDWAELERRRPPQQDTSSLAPVHTRAEIEARGDTAHRFAIASGVSYGLAAVVLGAGIYLVTRGPAEAPLTIAPVLGDGWGVSLQGALP